MSITKIPDGVLAMNSFFPSRVSVEESAAVAPGSTNISVLENGQLVRYIRMPGAYDLVGGDGSAWKRASKLVR